MQAPTALEIYEAYGLIDTVAAPSPEQTPAEFLEDCEGAFGDTLFEFLLREGGEAGDEVSREDFVNRVNRAIDSLTNMRNKLIRQWAPLGNAPEGHWLEK